VAYRPVRDISRMDVGGTRTKDGSIRLEYPDPAISMLVAVGVRIDGVAEPLVFPSSPWAGCLSCRSPSSKSRHHLDLLCRRLGRPIRRLVHSSHPWSS